MPDQKEQFENGNCVKDWEIFDVLLKDFVSMCRMSFAQNFVNVYIIQGE